MFLDFFFKMRAAGIPCGTGEFLDLLRALDGYGKAEIPITPERFYFIARSTLTKDEKFFDRFDRVFAELFRNVIANEDAFRRLLDDWLQLARERSAAENGPNYEPEQLWKELQERLREQTERHDGGNKWIGTGGVSAFGHSGENPSGVRIGGTGRSGSAIDSLEARRYREYSDEERIGVRGFRIALRKLRDLRREGRPEFDLPESIKRTSQNGGDPTAVFQRSRKNRLTVILLTDVGGSMTPHAGTVSRLFTAASKIQHFREFKHYYFHNALYEFVFEDSWFSKSISIDDLYKKYDRETRIIFAGDACMNPYELFDKRHAFFEYYYKARQKEEANQRNVQSAYERIKDMREHFPHMVWLNPEPERGWSHETISAIADAIPMYPLTMGGLQRAIRQLMLK
ncbi:MAG: VWA domain-containing protein [Spirochaetia bacterium]|nr:VWA domain-containing protein [Spirochaetia bacterium]